MPSSFEIPHTNTNGILKKKRNKFWLTKNTQLGITDYYLLHHTGNQRHDRFPLTGPGKRRDLLPLAVYTTTRTTQDERRHKRDRALSPFDVGARVPMHTQPPRAALCCCCTFNTKVQHMLAATPSPTQRDWRRITSSEEKERTTTTTTTT